MVSLHNCPHPSEQPLFQKGAKPLLFLPNLVQQLIVLP